MHPSYIGNSDEPLFCVYHPPRSIAIRDEGVILCYPGVQEYMRVHWVYKKLAEFLSNAGFHVLRFDYYGTGDSAGDSTKAGLKRWKQDIQTCIAELKDIANTSRISLVGMRLGAAMAAEVCGEGVNIRTLVLWDPIVKGRTYLEELTKMHRELYWILPTARKDLKSENINELLGYSVSNELCMEIEEVNLFTLSHLTAERVLIFSSEERKEILDLNAHLSSVNAANEYKYVSDAGNWGKIESHFHRLVSVRIPQVITEALKEDLG